MLSPQAMTRTGLLGGSFNPAHRGASADQPRRARRARARRDLVAGLAGQPAEADEGHGAARRRASPRRAAMARRAPIRVTAIERELGTVYTAETLAALVRRFPTARFIWLMGADNLAQFHRWRDWRRIARAVPIAVATRPGYDGARPQGTRLGLVAALRPARGHGAELDGCGDRRRSCCLNLPPDPTSATAIRAANPDWHETATKSFQSQGRARRRDAPADQLRRSFAHKQHPLRPKTEPSSKPRRFMTSCFARSTTTRPSTSSPSRWPGNPTSPIIW